MISRENQLQADIYYRKAIELSPNYATLYRWYAQTLWVCPLNQPAYALSMAEHGVALDPMNSINHTVLGWAYEMNGRVDEVGKSFDRAIEISSTNVFSVREKIKYLRRHSEYSRAISAGLDALAGFQNYPRILYEITKSCRQLGDADKYEYWSSRVHQPGHIFYTRLVGAMLALDEGRIESAIQQYEVALEWWPDYWEIIHSIAYAHTRNEQPEALLDFVKTHALEMFDNESPEVPPQGAMLVADAAWALGETGEAAQADKLVELGLEIVRNGPCHAYFGYGVEIADVDMYAVQGNHRFALEALTQAVKDGYRNPEWLERSRFLDPLRSDPEFISAMDVIRAELAPQAAQLEEMERNGELPALPQ